MAQGTKDYDGIAASGFSASLRFNREKRDSDLSLKEQLMKFGTDAEKRKLRQNDLVVKDNAARVQQYEKAIELNAFS